MGIVRRIVGYAKARAAKRVLRMVLGGPLSTALMTAYLGKRAYDVYKGRKRLRYS